MLSTRNLFVFFASGVHWCVVEAEHTLILGAIVWSQRTSNIASSSRYFHSMFEKIKQLDQESMRYLCPQHCLHFLMLSKVPQCCQSHSWCWLPEPLMASRDLQCKIVIDPTPVFAQAFLFCATEFCCVGEKTRAHLEELQLKASFLWRPLLELGPLLVCTAYRLCFNWQSQLQNLLCRTREVIVAISLKKRMANSNPTEP